MKKNLKKEAAARQALRQEAEVGVTKRVSVDREEYDALCALRDNVFEDLKSKHLHLLARYKELIVVNNEQQNVVNRQHLELQHFKTYVDKIEDRDRVLTARVVKLEQELNQTPVKSDIEQPLFARK